MLGLCHGGRQDSWTDQGKRARRQEAVALSPHKLARRVIRLRPSPARPIKKSMSENRNLLLAIVLSAAVIFGWEYFVAMPQMKAQKPTSSTRVEQVQKHPAAPSAQTPQEREGAAHLTRVQALAAGGPRIAIQTPTIDGSLRLKGARIDDLRLRRYHETIDPRSPEIVLLSPTGTDYPYYAEFGWVAPEGAQIPVPDDSTPWKLQGGNTLSPGHPVTLVWNNGKGLVFTRKINVDS